MGKLLGTIFTISILTVSLGSPTVSFVAAETVNVKDNAPAEYTLLEPLPCVPSPPDKNGNSGVICQEGKLKNTVNFKDYVQYIFNLVIALAAVAAVFMTVWGGFQYMTSESIQKKGDGLKTVKNALGGLLLVLCSFLILRTIDPRLVEIPSTLVKPLDIKVDTSLTGGFFERIATEAQRYQAVGQVFVDSAKQAKTDVAVLEKRQDDLEFQIDELYDQGYTDTDPEVRDLKLQLNTTNNNIAIKKASVEVDLARSIINNGAISQTLQTVNLEKINGGNDITDINEAFDRGIDFVDKTRDTRVSVLQAMGAYEEINTVNDQANYAQTLLLLKKTEARIDATTLATRGFGLGRTAILDDKNLNEGDARALLLQDMTTSLTGIKNIKDQKLRDELLLQYNNTKDALNKKFL